MIEQMEFLSTFLETAKKSSPFVFKKKCIAKNSSKCQDKGSVDIEDF